METNEMIKKALEENYARTYDLSKRKKEKLIELWTMRACRFFVENNLDASTVEEDLEPTNLNHGLKFEKEAIKKY